jgi:hypothetical protein
MEDEEWVEGSRYSELTQRQGGTHSEAHYDQQLPAWRHVMVAGTQEIHCCECGDERRYKTMSIYARHCSIEHKSRATVSGLNKCEVCNHFFVEGLGFSRHQRKSACAETINNNRVNYLQAYTGNDEEAVVQGNNNTERLDGEEQIGYDELLGHFQKGLFNVHSAWQDLFYELVVSLLQYMCHDDVYTCMVNTEAFFLLPGLISHMRVVKGDITPVEMLRRLVGTEEHRGATAERILAEANRLRRKPRKERESSVNRPSAVASMVGKIEKLGREGRFNAAMVMCRKLEGTLTQVATVPDQLNWTIEQKRAKIAALHPDVRSVELDELPQLDLQSETESVQVTAEEVMDTIKNLRAQSAAGGSGWTNNCLRLLRVISLKQTAERQKEIGVLLAAVFNRLYRGEMPLEVRAMWTRTRSALIPKAVAGQPLDARPLGIRDVNYRLAARMLAAKVRSDLSQKLRPHQLAVGVRGGCEIGNKLMDLCYHRDNRYGREACESSGFLSVDVSNAFNTLSLVRILEIMRESCPELIRFFMWTYDRANSLVSGTGEVLGMRHIGVIQGDPLATLLCALALKPIAKSIQLLVNDETERASERGERVLSPGVIMFADDMYVWGSMGVLCRVADGLKDIYAQDGLQIVTRKSKLVGKRVHELGSAILPQGFTVSSEGAKVLGGPVGSDEYKEAFLRDCMVDIQPPQRAMQRLSARLCFLLTSLVLNSLPGYLIRVVRPELTLPFCQQYDGMVDGVLGQMLGLSPHDEALKELRGLPLHCGGLGVTRYAGVRAERAYICSQVVAQQFITQYVEEMGIGHASMQENIWGHRVLQGSAAESVFANITTEEQTELESDQPEVVNNLSKAIVKRIHQGISDRMLDTIRESGDNSKCAWYMSELCKEAGAWCHTLQGIEGGVNFFKSEDFIQMMRMRLLKPMHNTYGQRLVECGSCKSKHQGMRQFLRDDMTHPLACEGVQLYTVRHNHLRDMLAKLLEVHLKPVAAATVRVEEFVKGGIEDPQAPGVKMDVVVHLPGKTYYVDVAVVAPGCQRYIQCGSHNTILAAAAKREAEKTTAIQNALRGVDFKGPTLHFVPFVVEASGRLGKAASEFLEVSGVPGDQLRKFRTQVSVLLARYGGKMLQRVRMDSVGIAVRAA